MNLLQSKAVRRLLIVGGVGLVAICLLVLVTYEIVGVDVTSFMEDQPSVDYQEPPRRLAPEESVPLSRPVYLDIPADLTNPVPADAVSLQRGELLFSFHCTPCHGTSGQGNGPVVEFWQEGRRHPANLTEDRFREYPDAILYNIITQGLGGMPPLRENMTERQYWDVINFVHTLQP
ncbi:MAG: cytochrome c [Anaerolineae bacterium]|jgi:mono/diheme cytochrome c family protein